ncbi:xanthine dehydrogenase molybdopterin binding subunit [Mesorhizobium sp. SP-1A]|uniref:xanthine dehydrogenase molybdopterin binding subunit n=1 Tax=Mesorhizobium sp. SP-1A TaxID=3077840 RepID=UPI0028F73DCD|nr:xanthine dehydrogenase molybdopterin binding subunit [Mesorhizobium sp. SP-1A]
MADSRRTAPSLDRIRGAVHDRLQHDSALKHVTGTAEYIDDMREPAGTVQVLLARSPVAHGRVTSCDLSAVETAPGVVCVLRAADIPGTNDFSHGGTADDRILSDQLIEYAGQVMYAIVAETVHAARQALKLAKVEIEELPPVLDIDEAARREFYLAPPRTLARGDSAGALARAPHRLKGRVSNGGQEHFYLEGQISLAIPAEDGAVTILCSTQDPTAVQQIVARVLAVPSNHVTVETRRLGGGFGGKETMATHFAAVAALVARKTGRPAKCRLDRDDDMLITGKRHEFFVDYDVGFDDVGMLLGVEMDFYARCGNSLDQSIPVLNRALFHADNCYYLPNVRFTGYACKTHTVTAVAFRGFGSPQGMFAIERVVDAVAYHLGLDPLEVRRRNFYRDGSDTTPFNAVVKDNILHRLVPELEASSDYHRRRAEIAAFNAASPYLKKGIALTPIKYGVGFGLNFLNQAGALLHVYEDGSVTLNHGGIEMGQGLFLKVAQVVAQELQIDVENIRLTATSTDKVPNTVATAASSGTDLNAAAAQIAAGKIRRRITAFAADHFKVPEDQITFLPNRIRVGNQDVPFREMIHLAYMNRVALSASGHYRSPVNDYDPVALTGQPHRYYAYGAAVTEVIIDTLTGENKVTRVDILHDVGKSLNPAIDYGQLEGGFIQGMGWMTTEEIVWDSKGRLTTHAPSTYKIPACSDRPRDMRMAFAAWSENAAESVHGSKAIGEPPLCLGISVFSALCDAVRQANPDKPWPGMNAPATAEAILNAIELP